MKTTIFLLVPVLGLSLVAALSAADVNKLPPPANKAGVTYSTDIKPVFEKCCIKCHGPEKQKGKLRLDTLENVLKGGEDGKVVQPGKSADSMLVKAVARLDEDTAMPPEGKADPLSKEQVGLIRAWIDQGAK